MRVDKIGLWAVAGTLALLGACGDPPATSDSRGGSSTDGTDATNGRPTEGSTSTSGASDSASTTADAGSISDSLSGSTTMATTQGGSDPTASGGSTDDASTGDASTTGDMSTTGTSNSMEECMEKNPCNRGCNKNIWTLDADFDAGVLQNVDHDGPNNDQLQITTKNGLAGEWSIVRDGLEAGATWISVPHNTEPEGNVPMDTSITVEVRAADIKAELVNRPWVLAIDGALPDLTIGRFIEVRARLAINIPDPKVLTSPVLSDLCVLKVGD